MIDTFPEILMLGFFLGVFFVLTVIRFLAFIDEGYQIRREAEIAALKNSSSIEENLTILAHK